MPFARDRPRGRVGVRPFRVRNKNECKELVFGERKGFHDEFLVFFPMQFHPFLSRLLPGQLATVFTLDPFKFSDLFFNKVSDPVKRIG